MTDLLVDRAAAIYNSNVPMETPPPARETVEYHHEGTLVIHQRLGVLDDVPPTCVGDLDVVIGLFAHGSLV